MRFRTRTGSAVAVVWLLAVACFGCSSSGQPDVTPPAPAPASAPITGATAFEVSVMRRALAKNPPGSVRSIDVTRPPTSLLQRDDGTIDRNRFSARDVWLVVTVPAVASSDTPPVYEIPLWKGEIFAAAVQAEMRRAAVREPAAGLRAVVGFTVSEVDRSGRRTHSDTVLTTGNSGGDFVTADATARRDVVAHLASVGITRGSRGTVTVESVTLFEGVGPAPIIRLRLRSTTSGPRPLLAPVAVMPTYEGYLLIVDGPNGTPIEIDANVERAAYGSGWADPRYIKNTSDAFASLHG